MGSRYGAAGDLTLRSSRLCSKRRRLANGWRSSRLGASRLLTGLLRPVQADPICDRLYRHGLSGRSEAGVSGHSASSLQRNGSFGETEGSPTGWRRTVAREPAPGPHPVTPGRISPCPRPPGALRHNRVSPGSPLHRATRIRRLIRPPLRFFRAAREHVADQVFYIAERQLKLWRALPSQIGVQRIILGHSALVAHLSRSSCKTTEVRGCRLSLSDTAQSFVFSVFEQGLGTGPRSQRLINAMIRHWRHWENRH